MLLFSRSQARPPVLGLGCRRSDAPFLAMDFAVGAGCCVTVDQGVKLRTKSKHTDFALSVNIPIVLYPLLYHI